MEKAELALKYRSSGFEPPPFLSGPISVKIPRSRYPEYAEATKGSPKSIYELDYIMFLKKLVHALF